MGKLMSTAERNFARGCLASWVIGMISWVLLATMLLVTMPSTTLASQSDFKMENDQPKVASETASVLRFRDMFRHVARRMGYSDADVHEQIFLPPPELLLPPTEALSAASPKAALQVLVKQAAKVTPTQLYQYGIKTPFGPDIDTDAIFADKGPITFVIIAGVIEEAIPNLPFQEIINDGGAFRAQFQDAISSIQDSAYDLATLHEGGIRIEDRAVLGSIDDDDHHPRVQLIGLRAKLGSLESLGKIADTAAINLRRLGKILELIPSAASGPIYLMGYQRGAPVALEMVTQMHSAPQQFDFSGRVKGILSLTGNLYGNEIPDGFGDSANSGLARSMFDAEGAATLRESGLGDDLGDNKIFNSDFMVIIRTLAKGFSVIFHNPLDIAGNIQRAKILGDSVCMATRELTTNGRLSWWRSHKLTPNFKIFSIAASMPESTKLHRHIPLINSRHYGQDSIDYKNFLRESADLLYFTTGGALNDSQLVQTKMRVYPSLVNKFNLAQPPLTTYDLGVVGTHHWGIALPSVFPRINDQVNPFPRRVLLEAMGAFVLAPDEK